MAMDDILARLKDRYPNEPLVDELEAELSGDLEMELDEDGMPLEGDEEELGLFDESEELLEDEGVEGELDFDMFAIGMGEEEDADLMDDEEEEDELLEEESVHAKRYPKKKKR